MKESTVTLQGNMGEMKLLGVTFATSLLPGVHAYAFYDLISFQGHGALNGTKC